MAAKGVEIIVAGDLSIDLFEIPLSSNANDYFWAAQDGPPDMSGASRLVKRPGGALLLADFVEFAVGEYVFTHDIVVRDDERHDNLPHTLVELALFPQVPNDSIRQPSVYRVRRMRRLISTQEVDNLPRLRDEPTAPSVIVIFDEGGPFRKCEKSWPRSLSEAGEVPVLVVLTRLPTRDGELWTKIANCPAAMTVAVVVADDLRAAGARISKGLSWDRSVEDLNRYLQSEGPDHLRRCQNLIVLFGLEAALLRQRDNRTGHFYFDPALAEGDLRTVAGGQMIGLVPAFVAALVAQLQTGTVAGLDNGIAAGLRSARRLQLENFGDDPARVDYPLLQIFDPVPEPDSIVSVSDVYDITATQVKLSSRLRRLAMEIARDVVMDGIAVGLRETPHARFGNYVAVDRTEIEQLRSLKLLLENALHSSSPTRKPISLAAFGQLGSGKNFVMEELTRTVATDSRSHFSVDLSQFKNQTDLTSVFHHVRDQVQTGHVPIVFFENFDTDLDGKRLGWLPHFLRPMQDGVVLGKEGDMTIGHAVFVFMANTEPSFNQFAAMNSRTEKTRSEFVQAKGLDFISRLQGWFDVIGINRAETRPYDETLPIRRAIILRQLLESGWPDLFDADRRPRLDERILRAFLNAPLYRYGIRSLKTILENSLRSHSERFVPSMLPNWQTMELHVDAEAFSSLLRHFPN